MQHRLQHTSQSNGLSPVRKLEREAMVGSLADVGPTDGLSNLQKAQAEFVAKNNLGADQYS